MNKPYIVLLDNDYVSELTGKYTTFKYDCNDLYTDIYITNSEVVFLQLKYDIHFTECIHVIIVYFRNVDNKFVVSVLNELRPSTHE